MPDPQTSDELQPMEASTASPPDRPMNFPNLPFGAAMRRPSVIGMYGLRQMIELPRFEGLRVHLLPGNYILIPQMSGGVIIQQMEQPRGPLINFQGGRGMEPPRGIQRRGMGSGGMEPPGIAPRGMAQPQGTEPQRSREPKDKEPKGNQSMKPREMEKEDMEPPRGMKRKHPEAWSKARCKNTKAKKN